MTDRVGKVSVAPRKNIALVGPSGSGKTTFLESILSVCQAVRRKGSIRDCNTIGDRSPEARARNTSVEVTAAIAKYQEFEFTFLDCPGSIEFIQETHNALIGVDAAIVVCEPVLERVLTLAPLLKFLDDWEIPHLIFINKLERSSDPFMEVLHALNNVSQRPLLPQQYPIREGRDLVGYIDLITEQAYHYHPGAAADPIPLPEPLRASEQTARDELLETLADFDDRLLEEILNDIEPPTEEILQDLKQELGADTIVPVFFGNAEQDTGIRPLLEALMREAPAPELTAQRRGMGGRIEDRFVGQVLKTYYSSQGGKLSLVRIWQGTVAEGMIVNGARIGGIYNLLGNQQTSIQRTQAGQIVAIARLRAQTGEAIVVGEAPQDWGLPRAAQLPPAYALATNPQNRKDDVKLSGAIAKLLEEDPALSWEQNERTHEAVLRGQGEIHLQVALDRLERKYNLPMTTHLPQVPYKETIRLSTAAQGRYKHQTGGHGAFGDVKLHIEPLPRGAGFQFAQKIVGGVVPKQYIPGVEMGVRDFLLCGPLGFPIVDVAVTLVDGSYHAVDSSEQAFKQAARLAMTDGFARCQPILLEPILAVTVSTPNMATANVLQLLTGQRGQILGYQARTDWPQWDVVEAYLPQAEMQEFIIRLRSLTMGVGFCEWQYDRLEEVPEKVRDRVLEGVTA
ncbi:MAG: elongation factor G [Cyanobacteria bacterium J06641_5]